MRLTRIFLIQEKQMVNIQEFIHLFKNTKHLLTRHSAKCWLCISGLNRHGPIPRGIYHKLAVISLFFNLDLCSQIICMFGSYISSSKVSALICLLIFQMCQQYHFLNVFTNLK